LSALNLSNHYLAITHKTLKLNKNAINLKNIMNGKHEKQFEGLIGCANFGIVYKAMNRKDGKVYAIKKIAFNETLI